MLLLKCLCLSVFEHMEKSYCDYNCIFVSTSLQTLHIGANHGARSKSSLKAFTHKSDV